ncbi:MAG: hypothetical protein R8G34_19045 [Paracoccaceae bacterium]|nr:hypothetical protein [Paracoccaceae bacterium]
MNKPIEIKAHERDTIRVFAINKAATEVVEALKVAPKADVARQLLGDPHLNTASAEIFPVADLTGMGLSAYLSEGYAVQTDQIAQDRNKLDALEGYVLLLFSDSFAGAATRLALGQALTLIGTYTEYQPSTPSGSLKTDSAKLYSGGLAQQNQAPKKTPSGSAITVLIFAVLVGIGLWWLL